MAKTIKAWAISKFELAPHQQDGVLTFRVESPDGAELPWSRYTC